MPPPGPSNAAPMQASIETILEDRHCSECGYSLKGLSAAGLCPECGEPCATGILRGIAGERIVDNSELGSAPLTYLVPLAAGLLLCGLSGLALTWFVFRMIATTLEAAEVRVGLAAASVWFLSVLILLREQPRPADEASNPAELAPWPLKLLLVLTQAAWIALAAICHLEMTGTPPLGIVKWLALAVGLLGIPGLPWLLSYTALWSMHQTLADWLRGAAWMLAVGGLVSMTIQTCLILKLDWALVFTFPNFVGRALWLGSLAATSLMALQMVIDVRWAIINARERHDRDRRIAERRRRHDQAMAASAPPFVPPTPAREANASLPDSSPSAPPPEAMKYQHRDEARMEPGKDVQPYALEDTDPPR